jgi:hypothetical protein
MSFYRKKPVVIEAYQFMPIAWRWFEQWGAPNISALGNNVNGEFISIALLIKTLEGSMEARPGDWIIKGVKGEFYPCKTDIFEATYEAVEP